MPLRGKGAEERIAKEQKEAIAKKYNEKNGTSIKAEDIEHIELKGATKGTGTEFVYDQDKLNDSNFYRNMEDLEAFKKKLGKSCDIIRIDSVDEEKYLDDKRERFARAIVAGEGLLRAYRNADRKSVV